VYRPSGHPGPLPVVLVLHGGGGDAAGMERLSGFDAAAGRYGFIAVYPDGYRRSWADGRGSSAADQAGVDDVACLGALVTRVDTDDDGDPARTYVTGISNGGMMSYRLACDPGGRIRAFAPVAAGMPAPLDGSCHPARPVPMLEIAGTADPIVPYGGGPVTVLGTGGRGEVRSAPETAGTPSPAAGTPGRVAASTCRSPSSGWRRGTSTRAT
jgi:polyhydroxybutyrate depolymerase